MTLSSLNLQWPNHVETVIFSASLPKTVLPNIFLLAWAPSMFLATNMQLKARSQLQSTMAPSEPSSELAKTPSVCVPAH